MVLPPLDECFMAGDSPKENELQSSFVFFH
jgi:hypothetical protein